MQKSHFVALGICLLVCLPSKPGAPLAGPITLTVSNAANYRLRPGENSRAVQVQIGTYKVAPILVPPNTPADTKAGLIYGALVGLPLQGGFPYPNMTVSKQVGTAAVTIDGLPKGTVVQFSPNLTGEKRDTLTVALAPGEQGPAEIGFQNNAFASTDADGNDSVFTAGIISDVGELSFTLDESTLPNLKGSTIVAALYEDLAPLIGSYDAQIVNYHTGDDVLQFVFNSTDLAGIVFGTTAETDGVFGQIQDVPEPPTLAALGGALILLALIQRRRSSLLSGNRGGQAPMRAQSSESGHIPLGVTAL